MANPHRSDIPAKPVSPPPTLSPAIQTPLRNTKSTF
ncbi:BnaC01g35370D [Brassica napus]|uniref:Uncharacterized protein n=2 Tax=Brassica TaxID=3705 RepID=A0A3P6B5U0_BRAOL|nr:unnamed protein product [Brassica napus]CAF2216705.1 unnamed protein product [Brassica napus]CDY28367.1 BnaC01g35370D [Brassica napus]VDD00333.1 unnamed protein product [Brassica oleracea]VDD00341.1 unnamed protein product [Brassica oleracea]